MSSAYALGGGTFNSGNWLTQPVASPTTTVVVGPPGPMGPAGPMGPPANLSFLGGAGLVLPCQATATASPETGQLYFDTTLRVLRIFDGHQWNDLTTLPSRIGVASVPPPPPPPTADEMAAARALLLRVASEMEG